MDKKPEIEKLKAEIGRLKKELKKKKRYGLVWDSEREPEEVVEMCKEKLPVLKEVRSKEIVTDKDKPVNLLIEGDNYHALSVLNYTHKGKIDVIYIDPPYNTGNKDFIYNDHYIDREDSYRHSKWLSFMEKRLRLAKNLLKDMGVIFISIDDNEVAQLKLLMDYPDLFGEKNFIANMIRITGSTRNMAVNVDIRNDYLLFYSKNISKFSIIELQRENTENFINPDNDLRGAWSTQDLSVRTGGFKYQIPSINGKRQFYKNWAKRADELKSLMGGNINDSFVNIYKKFVFKVKVKNKEWFVVGKVVFKGSDNVPNFKKYLSDVQGITVNSLWSDVESQKYANDQLIKILGSKLFDNPKPVGLLKKILKISADKNAIVLDFFAGSGTTGHSVLELNREDDGNRKFILCTNNENNICEKVTYPRIKNVIKGYKTHNLGDKVVGLGGNLKYFKTDFVNFKESTDKNKIRLTEEAIEMLCVKEGTFEEVENRVGFKIFKNSEHYAGIIFDQLAIKEFKKVIKDIKGKFSVYIFSLGDDSFDDEFGDIKQKVKLSPIPEAILKVYRRIFK